MNFLDPVSTSDGSPYGPFRFKQIVKERYVIAKNMGTSYLDIGKITPLERQYLMQFIIEEDRKNKEYLERVKQQREANRKG